MNNQVLGYCSIVFLKVKVQRHTVTLFQRTGEQCKMTIYWKQEPQFHTHSFPLEQWGAHYNSSRGHCSTCLALMEQTAQSPAVLSCPGASFGRSFPLSRPCGCRWVKASAEKKLRSYLSKKKTVTFQDQWRNLKYLFGWNETGPLGTRWQTVNRWRGRLTPTWDSWVRK